MNEPDRKLILLRAAYDLLAETARWDDADCDGYCLMEEIAEELGIEE